MAAKELICETDHRDHTSATGLRPRRDIRMLSRMVPTAVASTCVCVCVKADQWPGLRRSLQLFNTVVFLQQCAGEDQRSAVRHCTSQYAGTAPLIRYKRATRRVGKGMNCQWKCLPAMLLYVNPLISYTLLAPSLAGSSQLDSSFGNSGGIG
jgi:hypothetical protein